MAYDSSNTNFVRAVYDVHGNTAYTTRDGSLVSVMYDPVAKIFRLSDGSTVDIVTGVITNPAGQTSGTGTGGTVQVITANNVIANMSNFTAAELAALRAAFGVGTSGGGTVSTSQVISALPTYTQAELDAIKIALGISVRTQTAAPTIVVLGSEIRAGTDISVNPGTYTTEDGDIRKYRIIQVDNVATNANPVILQSAGSNNYNIAATAGKYIVAQELFFNALDAITGTYPAGSIGPVLGLAARRTAAQWLTAYSPNFINLGQALDAYRLDYDQVITQQLIQLIATSGVTGVVIPVRASVYASADAAAVVPESLFTRVTEVIGWCRAAGLGMIITPLHHYARFAGDVENSTYNDPLETAVDPAIHKTRAKNIVKQFITRYETDAQDDIAWQALNEPNSMDSALLNSFLSELVAETINLSNRPLFISPLAQSKATELNKLRPVLQTLAGNTKIALNLHHYSPAFWALQAAPSGWVSGQPIPAAPIQWSNSYLAGIYQVMKTAKWEIDEYNFPTILGEYGASIFAGTDAQRMVGIRAQKQAAAFYNIPAAAWMFGSDFAVMDRVNNVWSWKPDALSAIKDVTQTLGQGPANMIAFTAADIQAARKSVAAGRTAMVANTDYTLAADGTISFSAGMADAAPIPANRAQVYIFGSLAVPLKPNTRYLLSIASLNGADVYFNVGSGKAAVSNPWGPAPVIPSVNDGAMLADKKTNTFEFTTPAAVGTDHWFAIYYCSGSIGTSKVHFHMCEVV